MSLFNKKEMALQTEVPKHIAVIMDGNGRWAKKRGLPRTFGHKAGAEVFRNIAIYCQEIGVQYFTVYAFSTENWKRPKEEVNTLMNLFRGYLKESFETMRKRGVAIRVIGDLTPLADDIQKLIRETSEVADSVGENAVTATLCINYGGRDELKNAVKRIAHLVENGQISPEEITEQTISSHLYTSKMPDPDLIIRPSGEIRTSNFLIWQAAYSEYYFTDTLWPDFKPEDLDKAIKAYNQRNRRFGGI